MMVAAIPDSISSRFDAQLKSVEASPKLKSDNPSVFLMMFNTPQGGQCV
jgi:hypothetical protein